MAIIKSAKKAHRQAKRRRIFNLRRTRAMKDAVGEFKKTITAKGTPNVSTLYQTIDKAVKRGVIKANTAARMKSRLTRRMSTGAK
ncbi:MAG: 30S ribosomal protein S20 [Parcubacteria group bacterium]|nr:30S ribosomal protein S20 [Parcubacteria group bacterium]